MNELKKYELSSYPYNCIGVVLSYYKGKAELVYGTGFLIGEMHVLTDAHNCYNRNLKDCPLAERVYFIPDAHGRDIEDGRVKVADVKFSGPFADAKDQN